MLDRPGHDPVNDAAPLAAALRRLPAQAPPYDAWPWLAARARRRRRLRGGIRALLPLAAAAAITAVMLVPMLAHRGAKPVPVTASGVATRRPADTATRQIAALRSRSQRLEDWVRQLAAGGAPLDGAALAQATNLEDLIALVDLQLGASHAARTQLPLWRQRVTLLQQLAMVRLTDGGTVAGNAASPHSRYWID